MIEQDGQLTNEFEVRFLLCFYDKVTLSFVFSNLTFNSIDDTILSFGFLKTENIFRHILPNYLT